MTTPPSASHPPRVVVKIGGSLLDWPRLPVALPALLDSLHGTIGRVVVVTGGGRFADELRRLDSIHRLATSAVHHLAIETMDHTARLLPHICPDIPWATPHDQAELGQTLMENKVPILCPTSWLRLFEPDTQATLPVGWGTTSDSIAAFLASRLGMRTLLLAKSTRPRPAQGLAEAVSSGLVDASFPELCRSLDRVGVVHLREQGTPIHWLVQLAPGSTSGSEPCGSIRESPA